MAFSYSFRQVLLLDINITTFLTCQHTFFLAIVCHGLVSIEKIVSLKSYMEMSPKGTGNKCIQMQSLIAIIKFYRIVETSNN
jgi:hypothetical protein